LFAFFDSLRLRQVSWSSGLAFGVGTGAEGLKDAAFHLFLVFYYSQVLGLPATLAGLVSSIALVFDAVTEPFMGTVSDRWRSRLGRRHPFMFASSVPFGISIYMLFAPPSLTESGLFWWMLGWSLLTRVFLTLFHTPHLALGGELSEDYQERTLLFTLSSLFRHGLNKLTPVLAYGLVFTATAQFPQGQLNPDRYPVFGLATGIVVSGLILLSAFGTLKDVPRLAKPPADLPRFRLYDPFVELWDALRTRSFRWLFAAMTVNHIRGGLVAVLTIYINTYIFGFTAEQIAVLSVVILASVFVGTLVTPVMTSALDKKGTVLWALMLHLVFTLIPLALWLAGWMPPDGSAGTLAAVCAFQFVAQALVMAYDTVKWALIPDVVDDHELRSHRRQEGIFYAAISLANKATWGVGTLIAGITLDAIAFPRGVAVDAVPADVVLALGWLVGPALFVVGLVPLAMFVVFPIDIARHREIVRALAARREAVS
jgi:GPH family glycoside/pentoside/hexuronide:cation symporter